MLLFVLVNRSLRVNLAISRSSSLAKQDSPCNNLTLISLLPRTTVNPLRKPRQFIRSKKPKPSSTRLIRNRNHSRNSNRINSSSLLSNSKHNNSPPRCNINTRGIIHSSSSSTYRTNLIIRQFTIILIPRITVPLHTRGLWVIDYL